MSPDVARHALHPIFSTRPGHHGWDLARSAGSIRQRGSAVILESVQGKGTVAPVYLPAIDSDGPTLAR